MNQEIRNYVMQKMSPFLDNGQTLRLERILEEVQLKQENGNDYEEDNAELLEKFISAKRLEGRSDGTLNYYQFTIEKMFEDIGKNIRAITTEDLRDYLSRYYTEKEVSKVTIDNIRRNLSSFFTWLEDENYIYKSPFRRIHKIKTTISVKDIYADEDLEKLRDDCKELRNLAIIDILYSTGMRVGELVNLNRSDIDFNERECVVLGKGDKERIVYFDARTKIHLKKYLNKRVDKNPALFVSLKYPYKRLQASGVEIMLRKMGIASDVGHVHPHKFRRTMATAAIDKGMPIEQVQRLLGHEKIDTTLRYAQVKQSNVKSAHKKYIG